MQLPSVYHHCAYRILGRKSMSEARCLERQVGRRGTIQRRQTAQGKEYLCSLLSQVLIRAYAKWQVILHMEMSPKPQGLSLVTACTLSCQVPTTYVD